MLIVRFYLAWMDGDAMIIKIGNTVELADLGATGTWRVQGMMGSVWVFFKKI